MTLEYPDDLQYLDSHEYVRIEGEIATIGISAFAVDQLGDIVFIEIPQEGDKLTQGERFGTIESVKAVEEMYSPVTGTVIESNQAIADTPEELAADPYGEGWLVKVRLDNEDDIEGALTATAYQALVEGDE